MKIALIVNSRSKEVKNQNLSPDLEKKLLKGTHRENPAVQFIKAKSANV
jgi:hypothetical protein